VRLESSLITAGDGKRLDGEFTGTFPTGNGTQGGNFNFVARRDRSSTPRVRMTTTEGVIILSMRRDVAPAHASNFLDYANSGRYDNVFFTRSENNPQPFVIQGGSLQITGDGQQAGDIIATDRFAAVPDENDRQDALSNTIGTLSFAKSGPDTATNQFFINLADNSFLDSPLRGDGGFTVFAEISSGLAVAQAINQLPVADLQSQIGSQAGSTNTSIGNVPVQNEAQAEAALNPFRDLPYIRRVAGVMKLGALA
jgi:cyclophilin family peptidyl-prolyl cis-trans isomerase